MKKTSQRQVSLRQRALWLLFVLIAFAAVPAAFPEDPPQKGSKDPTPVKQPNRDIPVQDIFDTTGAKVEVVADGLEYAKDSGKMIARGNAVITYQRTRILADYAEVETNAKKAYARGHVMIFEKNEPRLQGEEIYYDFGKQTGHFPNARAMSPPWYARGKDIQQVREGVEKIQSGGVTTCNLEKPHYEIRCKKATLYMNEKLLMYNVTIYVLGKPVFWLPFMDVPLNWPNIPVQVKVGNSTQYGAYILLSKGITFNEYLWGKAHIDWRSKRGFGAGWNQYYNFKKYAHGNVKLYLTQDKKAPTPGYVNPVSGQSDPYAKREDRERGRITWRHRTDFNEHTHVILRYHRVADQYFLQDFFEDEFRADMQPKSFVTGIHNTERYGLMAHAEKKMNSYESMVERLPEIRLDWKNQPFFTDKVFNESRAQFDNLTITYPHSTLRQKAVRGDVSTRWYAPLKWQDVSLMPFAGYRGTEYNHILNSDASRYRNVIEYGADLRTHFYRMFDVSFDKLGVEVNQLRHVVEPSVLFQGTSSTISNEKLIHFDTVDVLDDAAEVVFGLENRLQTKRVVNGKNQRVDIVSLNTFIHFEASPKDSSVEGHRFTAFDGELVLRPYEWLQFQTRAEYDFYKEFLKFTSNDMIIRKGPMRLVLGYRYMHPHYDSYSALLIPKSQELIADLRYQINRLWEVGGYIRWDTSTSGIQEYQVSAARDLHDFILEFGYNMRNSLINNNNNQLFFDFRMKGVPGAQFHQGGGRASFSDPRIGETVAGSNQGAGRYSSPTLTGQDPLISSMY